MARRRRRRNSNGILIALILILMVILAGLLFLLLNMPEAAPDQGTVFTEPTETRPVETVPETEPETEPPTTLPPEPEHVVATATIGATGDILMHMPVVDTGRQRDGSYNFDYMFRYLSPYSVSVDYAVANLETTLCGTDNGYPYHGYPNFNCPDEIVDGLKNAGFDMLLTANNHCFDTRMVGYQRTLEVIESRGLQALGTMSTPEDPKYVIQDINGIKVGMLCYTYETPIPENGYAGRVYLNGLAMDKGGEEIINSFLPSNPGPFFAEVEQYIGEMKDAGAEATVMFIHWGEEYVLSTIPYQKQFAQKLCDLGIDVIVGGHPHVVEPVELLTSTVDPEHSTVCLYSMGNAVSNQRLGNLSAISTPHTEDGVWFTFTFAKYSDDTVYLEGVELIPCWVDLRTSGSREYNIIPLDDTITDDWQVSFDLSDTGLGAAQRSYERTMKIVGEGLTASQEFLAEQKQLREDNYLAEVQALIEASN